MGLNLGAALRDCLEHHQGKKLTARQIAEWIPTAYPSDCSAKLAASKKLKTNEDLVRQLAAEIGSIRPSLQRKHPDLRTTEERPRRYFLSQQTEGAEVEAAEREGVLADGEDGAIRLSEQELYPLLAKYVWSEFRVYPQRIDEKRSKNLRGLKGNHWLHPDLVGMEDLGADWHDEVRHCVRESSDKRSKLWSFEAKLLVNRSNVRESYFQAVSNSSWSNWGYLVAAEIEGSDTLKELRMLFASHGIGVMRIDVQDPSESQILIPARERSEIDWGTANRLAAENADFLDFVKLVRQFHQTGEIKERDWFLGGTSSR